MFRLVEYSSEHPEGRPLTADFRTADEAHQFMSHRPGVWTKLSETQWSVGVEGELATVKLEKID